MKSQITLFVAIFFLFAFSPLHAEESVDWKPCVNEIKLAHPDLYTAHAILQQAESDKQITGGSLLLQLSLSVSSFENGTSGQSSTSSASYALSAKQLLFDGHKTSNKIASNTEAIKSNGTG